MKTKRFLPAIITFVAYWPLAGIMSLITHSMAWNNGPEGIGQTILYYFTKLLYPLPGGLIINCLFITFVVFLITLGVYQIARNSTKK